MSELKKDNLIIDYEKIEAERQAKKEAMLKHLHDEQARAEAEAKQITDLMLKGYHQKQEELQKAQAADIEAEAQAAADQIRARYRAQTSEAWADDETRAAYRRMAKSLLNQDKE